MFQKLRFEFPSTGADRKVWISLIILKLSLPGSRHLQVTQGEPADIHNERAQPSSFP